MASITADLPTPKVRRAAAIIGEKIVATDWNDVLSPKALPKFVPALSATSTCIKGKSDALKKPIERAPTRSREIFPESKKNTV